MMVFLPGGLTSTAPCHLSAVIRFADSRKAFNDALAVMDWVNLYALAVNEENASGGRVVTAPYQWCSRRDTCGYALLSRFLSSYTLQGLHDFLLTAAAIGIRYQRKCQHLRRRSGCQGRSGRRVHGGGRVNLCAWW